MKYISIIALCLLFSCGKKEEVLLPKSNVTVEKKVEDWSPIYIFFKTDGKDTLAEVNRRNSIISTNWIFNIDKRLPLRLVVPEVIKLQDKKRAEKAHKNEKAQNYLSYADTISKNLAFLPFTKVHYKLDKPNKTDCILHFTKNDRIQFNNQAEFPVTELEEFLAKLRREEETAIVVSFDKNLSYGAYVQYKIRIAQVKITDNGWWINQDKEYIK